MKTLLIYPSRTRHSLPPLGVAYVASVLRENSFPVKIVDFNSLQNDDDVIPIFNSYQPDLVGFSVQTNAFDLALVYAKKFKEINPNVIVVFGDPHPSVLPEMILDNSSIDIYVIGEGEAIFLNLLKSLEYKKNYYDVKGIVYKKEGKICKNEREPFIQDLDSLPYPARDLLPMDVYLRNIPPPPLSMPFTHVLAMRGCSFNCNYCQPTNNIMWGRAVRKRSPEKICDEIEFIKDKYKLKSLDLSAETFTIDKKWAHAFCDEFKKRKIDLSWVSTARINTVDYELLKKMKSANCLVINPGVESGSQRVLNSLRKGITISQIKDYFKWCNELNLITNANFMVGNLDDDVESLEETLKLIKEIKPDYLTAYITNPLPGTDLYTEAVAKNLINFEDFSCVNRHNSGNLKLNNLTNEQVVKYRDKIYDTYFHMRLGYFLNPKKFYLHKNMIKRIISLRRMRFKAVKKSYNLLQTTKTSPLKKIREMIIKAL